MKVGYLGPESSFSHQAARRQFPGELVAFATIPACLRGILEDQIQLALVPVENSLEGSVHATIDFLSRSEDLTVFSEIVLPIKQQLLANGDQNFQRILSHPQALAQSQKYLEKHYPEAFLEPTASTAAAAEFVAAHPELKAAAVAPQEAAERYGLQIIAADIQDNDYNQTRFWLIGKKEQPENFGEPCKMTIVLTLPSNQPGALHKALAAFGWRDISLSKIESRPLKTNLGEYFFVIDLLLDQPQQLIDNALEEIHLLGADARSLGAYPVKIIQ